jgi:hypothetical protein
MVELTLKDLVPGKRYIDEDGDEFEFIGHSSSRPGSEGVGDYGQRIGLVMFLRHRHGKHTFRPAPERHSRIFAIYARPDGDKLSATFADAEHVKRWAAMHDRKILAAKQVFITEGEFSEGLEA